VRLGIGLVLAIDALALAVVLATAPAAYLWLDGSRPSPLAVSSAGASGPGAASPTATGSFGAASPSPSGAGATPTRPSPTPTLTYGNGIWTRIPALPQALWGAGSAVLGDGRLLVVGGSTGPVSSTAVATAEILDPKTSAWSAATPMLQARTYPATVTLPVCVTSSELWLIEWLTTNENIAVVSDGTLTLGPHFGAAVISARTTIDDKTVIRYIQCQVVKG